jgi:hypothetical protein
LSEFRTTVASQGIVLGAGLRSRLSSEGAAVPQSVQKEPGRLNGETDARTEDVLKQDDLGWNEPLGDTAEWTDPTEVDGIFAIVEALVDHIAKRDPNWPIRWDISRLRQILDDDGYVLCEDGRILSTTSALYAPGSSGRD